MYIEFWWGQPLLRTSGQSYYNTVQVGVAATLKIYNGKIADSNLGRDMDYTT
jgi:hypothetical protein